MSAPAQIRQSRLEFILMISGVMMLVAFAIDSMLPALPMIGASFAVADPANWPMVISAFLGGFGVSLLFVGTLSDRYGRRGLLLGSLFGFAVTSVAASYAPSFEWLLIARALQGMAAAGGQVLVRALVRDLYDGREMAQIMSFAGMFFMVGPIIAPSMGQIVLEFAPWPWIFTVLAVLGLAMFLWCLVRMEETLAIEKRRPIEVAVVKDAARIVLTDRLSLGYTLAQAAVLCGLFGFLTSVQAIFDRSFGVPEFLPTGFAIMASGMMAASLLNATIVKRFGMRMISHCAMIAFTAVAAFHAFYAWSGYETLFSFVLLQTVMMLAFPLVGGNFQAMSMERMGRVAGTASSVQGFIINLISTVGGIVIGRAYDGSTVPLYIGITALGMVAILIVFVTEQGHLFVARNCPAGE